MAFLIQVTPPHAVDVETPRTIEGDSTKKPRAEGAAAGALAF
jgi:hypothetical protein